MFQVINDLKVYVVDLSNLSPPDLPIHSGGSAELAPYAQALDAAIRKGTVKEPGKYAIYIHEDGINWAVFRVSE